VQWDPLVKAVKDQASSFSRPGVAISTLSINSDPSIETSMLFDGHGQILKCWAFDLAKKRARAQPARCSYPNRTREIDWADGGLNFFVGSCEEVPAMGGELG
jgi:hypothetical protein